MKMARVYVGGLHYSCRERDLERFFKKYGRLRDCLLKNGYGFVEFEDERDADDAVYEMNGRELLGERVTVEHARGLPRRGGYSGYGGGGGGGGGGRDRDRDRRPAWLERAKWSKPSDLHRRYGPPTRTPYRVIVENLSSRISWQDLKDYMRKAGEITFADAHKHRRYEGVVEFATRADMKRAIRELDDTELNGRRIRLIEDRPSRSRSKSRRRSRSRSRSKRSYSRSRSHSRSRSRSRSRGSRRSRSRSSRSRSRDSRSRSQSRSKSRSRSRSKSSDAKRSRSRSRERDSRSRSGSRKMSEEPEDKPKDDRRSRSRSRSPYEKDEDAGMRSRSASPKRESRSRSRSPQENGHDGCDDD